MKLFSKKQENTIVEDKSEKKDSIIKRFFKKIGGFIKSHKVLVIVVVIIIAVVFYMKYKAKQAMEAYEAQMNQPTTATVEQMDLQQSVSVTGTLVANETTTVTSTLGGTGVTGVKVAKVNYEVGDYVEAGTIVVEFDGDDYDRKIAELSAQYSINDMESAMSIDDYNKKIDDLVKQIDEDQKYLDDNRDIYNNLKDAYEKYEDIGKLPGSGEEARWLSQSQIAMALADPVSIEIYEKKEDAVEDAQYQITLYQKQIELLQLKQDYATNYTQVDAYDDVYESKEKTTVEAPISGYILSMNVEEGNNYTQGNTVFTIADTSGFIVEATVNEYDIANIKEGLPAAVRFEATGDEEFNGTVSFVAVASESSVSTQTATSAYSAAATGATSSGSTATYKIKITMDDTDDRFRVGMTAKASVILDSVSNVIAVPYDCVQDAEDGSKFVNIINDDGTEKKVTVTTGLESDYYVEVKGDGLEKGMTVEAIVTDAPSTDIQDYITYDDGGEY